MNVESRRYHITAGGTIPEEITKNKNIFKKIFHIKQERYTAEIKITDIVKNTETTIKIDGKTVEEVEKIKNKIFTDLNKEKNKFI